jgi:mxaK protein
MKKFWLSEPVLISLGAAFLLLAASIGLRVWDGYRLDRWSAAPDTIEITEATPPELVFAAARWKDEQGDYQQALSLYGSVQQAGSHEFQAAVRYNMATIYLRESAKLWNAVGVLEHARVSTLVQMAKENYQAVLRIEPENWDARFNLEYAYRITPPPRERPKADFQGTKTSVFSTLPSLPGGGP